MSKPHYVYVTYIQSTPEKVWQALTDGELTKEYWARRRNVSDWKEGSRWEHQDYDDPSHVDIVGKVLENKPPRRLVLSWAFPADAGDPEKVSRVTFNIEPYEDATRLTVMHEELEPDSPMLDGIQKGWPAVLSSLKTMLETGQSMPMFRRHLDAPPQ